MTSELTFHTDNAFARMVPDYVGLLCRNTAKCGGAGRICNLYTVHDRMQHRYPKQLARLYQPMYFDRQKEHYEGDAKVSLAPYFSWNGERLNARANTTLVRQGYEVAGEELDSDLVDALDAPGVRFRLFKSTRRAVRGFIRLKLAEMPGGCLHQRRRVALRLRLQDELAACRRVR